MENFEQRNHDEQGHFPTAERLHTDILEQKYGPIHAEVLRHDDVREAKKGEDRIREARLVDESNVLRTYALTFLGYDKNDKDIFRVDDKIRQGGLIGKTFREHGYIVKKNVIDVFILDIPEWMSADFKTDSQKAKARLTEFYTKGQDKAPLVYGTVLEIYSPDFKDPEDGISEFDKNQINPLTSALQSTGIPVDEIWERLDRSSEVDEWQDLSDRYEQAGEISQPIVSQLHKKINSYINSKK